MPSYSPSRAFRRSACTGAIAAASLAFAAAPAHAAAPVSIDASPAPIALLEPASGGLFGASVYDAEAQTADWRGRRGWGRRGWRGRGWRGRGWRGRGWRGRRGVGAGDVLAGVAIIGGIAAIASAANNRRDRDVVVDRDRRRYERDREWQRERERDRELTDLQRQMERQQREIDYLRSREADPRRARPSARSPEPFEQSVPPGSAARYGAPIDIDTAIDRCVEVIEIDAAVGEVDGVVRTDTGWSITGRIADGESFACRIGRDGQIESLENGSGFSSYDRNASVLAASGQWSPGAYSEARAQVRGESGYADRGTPMSPGAATLPPYPGGPLPGETYDERTYDNRGG